MRPSAWWLEEIYRQRNAPELKAIVERLHAGDHEAAFPKMRELCLYREAGDRAQTVAQLVEDVIAEKQAGKNPLAIAPVHRDGEAYAAALRVRMREEGLLGEAERKLTRLKPLHLTEAQMERPEHYEPGRVIEFHQPVKGGFQSGQQWTVVGADSEGVTVTRKGHEKVLSLDNVSEFSLYETETMPVSVGDDLQLTKNDRRGRGRNGDVRRVKGFDQGQLVLDNGCRLDLDRAQHARQGHTVTSQVSQSKEREKMFCLAMTSALPQINAAQALVDISRAQGEARVYTDSVQSFEVKVQADTGHRQAAVDFQEGTGAKVSRSREQPIRADLQEPAIKAPLTDVERFERALRAKVAEKAAGLDPAELEGRIAREVNAYAARHQKQQLAPEWAPGIDRTGLHHGHERDMGMECKQKATRHEPRQFGSLVRARPDPSGEHRDYRAPSG